jgi:hypothetical protein
MRSAWFPHLLAMTLLVACAADAIDSDPEAIGQAEQAQQARPAPADDLGEGPPPVAECEFKGDWNHDVRKRLYGDDYTKTVLFYGIGAPLNGLYEALPLEHQFSQLPSALLDAIAAECAATTTRIEQAAVCVSRRVVAEETARNGVCRNIASSVTLVLKRMGYDARNIWFSIHAWEGHVVVAVKMPQGGWMIFDPWHAPRECYTYTGPDFLVREVIAPAVDIANTTHAGLNALINGTDATGDPSRLTYQELRGQWCGGQEAGREVVRHSDSNYLSYTPRYENCRSCCEDDWKVWPVSVCMNACKGVCPTCEMGSGDGLSSTPMAANCARGAVLQAGQTLNAGEQLCSPNGRYVVFMQADGNLVVYNGNRPIWASNTMSSGATSMTIQTDGNLVVYAPGGPAAWDSGTAGAMGGYRLQIQDDGNLVIYIGETPVWSSLFGRQP